MTHEGLYDIPEEEPQKDDEEKMNVFLRLIKTEDGRKQLGIEKDDRVYQELTVWLQMLNENIVEQNLAEKSAILHRPTVSVEDLLQYYWDEELSAFLENCGLPEENHRKVDELIFNLQQAYFEVGI
jgi:hypothetical protein